MHDTTKTKRFGDYGGKYDQALDVAQITKLIRADVAHAQTLPESDPMNLPAGTKVSVRLQRYSGGRSISLTITAFPAHVLNPAHVARFEVTPNEFDQRFQRYTRTARRSLEVLERIANQWNYDRSDIQSDYFDCNFYVHTKFEHELETASRAATLDAHGELITKDMRVNAKGDRSFYDAQCQALDEGFRYDYELRALFTAPVSTPIPDSATVTA